HPTKKYKSLGSALDHISKVYNTDYKIISKGHQNEIEIEKVENKASINYQQRAKLGYAIAYEVSDCYQSGTANVKYYETGNNMGKVEYKESK
ncbi:10465_t:CDS:2, partial [Dentiscutata heterogama]